MVEVAPVNDGDRHKTHAGRRGRVGTRSPGFQHTTAPERNWAGTQLRRCRIEMTDIQSFAATIHSVGEASTPGKMTVGLFVAGFLSCGSGPHVPGYRQSWHQCRSLLSLQLGN